MITRAEARSLQDSPIIGGAPNVLALSCKASPYSVHKMVESTKLCESSFMRKVNEVFLLAENRLLREALSRIFNGKSDVRMVGACGYSPNVHREVIAARPHIILLDAHGLSLSYASLIPTLHAAVRSLRVVMVDMESNESTFLRAVRAGIVGYILKDASSPEVVASIRAVGAGQAVCPPSLSLLLLGKIAQKNYLSSSRWSGSDIGLSRREQDIVELLEERLTNKEIAARLNLSEQTIKNHMHHVLRKLGVSNRFRVIAHCQSLVSREQDNRSNNQAPTLVNASIPST